MFRKHPYSWILMYSCTYFFSDKFPGVELLGPKARTFWRLLIHITEPSSREFQPRHTMSAWKKSICVFTLSPTLLWFCLMTWKKWYFITGWICISLIMSGVNVLSFLFPLLWSVYSFAHFTGLETRYIFLKDF